MLSWFKDQ